MWKMGILITSWRSTLDSLNIVVAEEEQGNGCSLDYTLDGKLDKWELEAITEMLTTKRPKPFHTQALLNYLVSEGILEPGQYIIRISW